MASDQNKKNAQDADLAKSKGEGNKNNSINPKEDFHTESGEKKNAIQNGDKEQLMGMDSPDDAEELGNDTKTK